MSHFDQMTPAPWESDGVRLWGSDLRNALDVQMRRGWYSEQVSPGRWRLAKVFRYTLEDEAWWEQAKKEFDNPVTPLLEADAWYRKNVDGKP